MGERDDFAEPDLPPPRGPSLWRLAYIGLVLVALLGVLGWFRNLS